MDEQTTEQTTPAETTPATPAPPAETTTAPDYSAQLAAMQEQLAELRAAKAAADAAADEATQAAMTEGERLEAERNAWRAEVETERARLRGEARSAALERAGVLPAYHEYVPDLDPRTADGAKALEAWIKQHPETVKAATPAPSPLAAIGERSSAVAQILTGQRRSTLVSAKSLQAMFDKR